MGTCFSFFKYLANAQRKDNLRHLRRIYIYTQPKPPGGLLDGSIKENMEAEQYFSGRRPS